MPCRSFLLAALCALPLLALPAAGEEFYAGIVSGLSGPVPVVEIVPDLPVDAIPPIDEPRFAHADLATIEDGDMVMGVALGGEAYAYPLKILNFHEIVTHAVGGRRVAATYCPLTNSAVLVDASDISFGNTGALYNNNVVFYDRLTNSFWSQMALGSIYGQRAGEHLQILPAAQTTWGIWKRLYPDTFLLTERTGYSRNYRFDPFVGYSVNEIIPFRQAPPIDRRLHPKEMVFGLARDGEALAYPYTALSEALAVNDRFAGREVAVLYAPEARLALGYVRQTAEGLLHFQPAGQQGDLPLFADLETGSTWNVLGQATDGPLSGRQLAPVAAYSAYFFAWASFWQGTEIWDGDRGLPTTSAPERSWAQIKAGAPGGP